MRENNYWNAWRIATSLALTGFGTEQLFSLTSPNEGATGLRTDTMLPIQVEMMTSVGFVGSVDEEPTILQWKKKSEKWDLALIPYKFGENPWVVILTYSFYIENDARIVCYSCILKAS